jgi:hypothetical protein
METINLIEIVDNMPIGIKSFSVPDIQLSGQVSAEAEEEFKKIALENGMKEEDWDFWLEEGHFIKDNYSIWIIWSYPENIQY